MRNLDELLKVAQDAKSQYDEKVAASKEELQQAKNQLALAKASAELAIITGNHAMHTEATHNVDYYTQRVELLKNTIIEPYYTKEQHNELVAEISAALKEAVSPMYSRMAEIADEWNALVEQIDQENGKAEAAGYALRSAGTPSTGMQLAQWERPLLRSPSNDMRAIFKADRPYVHYLMGFRRKEE